MGVIVLRNIIMVVATYQLYHSHLVKSKSQVLPTLSGKGFCEGINTRGRDEGLTLFLTMPKNYFGWDRPRL